MIDSTTLVSETPFQASQTPNVRKCPVLSGPTDPAEKKDVSTDNHKTYVQIPSSPDRTLTASQPPAVPQQDQMPQSASIPLTTALRETFVDELPQHLSNEEERVRQEQGAHARLQPTTA